jgi:hypothetical protein
VAIPLCRRSVKFAWLRHACAALVTIFVILGGIAAPMMGNAPGGPEQVTRLRFLVLVCSVSGTGLFILGVLTWLHPRATPARAVELCRLAGLDPNRLYAHFHDRESRQQLETLLGPTPVNDLEIDSPQA